MASEPALAELTGAAGHLLVDRDPGSQRKQALDPSAFRGSSALQDLDSRYLRAGGGSAERGYVFARGDGSSEVVDEDGRVEENAHQPSSSSRSASARRSLSTYSTPSSRWGAIP